ncbi:MAG: DedA family protein [Patescibacteria group bacterium]|nr:DedA family protein [Patescibacteria group bacterium]
MTVEQLQNLINLLAPYVRTYGYYIAFFAMLLENSGIFFIVPGETIFVVLVFFASQGVLNVFLLVPLAFIGDIIGDNISFFIGRYGGRDLVARYGKYLAITKERIDAVEKLLRERGGITIFSAHFSSYTRVTTAFISGFTHIVIAKFVFFNTLAAATYITGTAAITYYFGRNLQLVVDIFNALRYVLIAILVILVIYYLVRYFRKRK